jgi:uncharacterized protein
VSNSQPPANAELTLGARDALVRLLLDDLSSVDGGGAVRAALCALERPVGSGDADGDDGLVALLVEPAQRSFARARVERYRAALDRAPRGGDVETRLAQARVLFAEALFFEVHEVLEPAWRDAAGAERLFLQGIIQAAVAWHHGGRGRGAPALRAASAACVKLADAPAQWRGFPVEALRAVLDRYRGAVAGGASPGPPPVDL